MDLIDKIKNLMIIDSHMHLGVTPNVLYYNYSDERVCQLQKKYNVKISICSLVTAIFGEINSQVEEIKKASEKFEEYFYWNLVYDPRKASKSLEILEKNRLKINFAGVKIHPVEHETRIDSRSYEPLWEYAQCNNIVILSHTWSPYTDNPKQFYGNPLLFGSVLDKYPKLRIILGHSGGKVNFYPEVIEFASKYKNIYMDFSGDTIYPPVFKMVIERIGKGRIVFGTDMPMMDIRYHIASVLAADIEESDREDIFYKTAAKLYCFK